MYSQVWFGPKSYINPYMLVHLPVSLVISNFMVSPLLVLYFCFTPFCPSYLEAFLDSFDVSAVAAVSMNLVGFYMISSFFGIWTNQLIVYLSRGTF